MSPLDQLRALENTQKAAEMAAYHKVKRAYLGVANPEINALVKDWQRDGTVHDWLPIAADLWDSDIHEARIAAGKLLTKARIQDDAAIWSEIQRWVPEFNSWAIADHACNAGERRLRAHPSRLDQVEAWTTNENFWVRRAALVMTLPWAKLTNPKPAEVEAQERILGWAANLADDPEWFIQKAISWWLRTLSKKDPARVTSFIEAHGAKMKAFARKDAVRKL